MPTAKKETTAETETNDVFVKLSSVDVTGHVEEKDTGKAKLKYLSWAWAWYEVRQRYPDATYTIVKNENNLPYFVDPYMGIMVYTTVTIAGETHEMWLPVMDGANNPMRLDGYDIQMKWGKKHVEPATMFDINKTIMRCLTKNLAMFGIGLALYAGEDLFDNPEGDKGVEAVETKAEVKSEPKKQAAKTEAKPETSAGGLELLSLEEVRKAVEVKIQAISQNMPNERKEKMAQWIEKMLGTMDYHRCDKVVEMNNLLSELNNMKVA